MLKDIREYYRKKLIELNHPVSKPKECPYNDPTLDWKDPYYMKPPFGGATIAPEHFNKIKKQNEKNDK